MATSSIFADFSIKDKKTARAFVKALEESEKDRFQMPKKKNWRIISDSKEIKLNLSKLFGQK